MAPNGEFFVFIGAQSDGIANVFSTNDFSVKDAEQITVFDAPEIIQFFWAARSDKLLLLKDEEGKGQLHVYAVELNSKKVMNCSEHFGAINAKIIHVSPDENKALIGINHRNVAFHDLYIFDLDAGSWTLLYRNDRYAKFFVSDELKVILKIQIDQQGNWIIFKENDEIFMTLSADDAFQTEFLRYDIKNRLVYFLDSRYFDTSALMAKSLDFPSSEHCLGHQQISDVDEVFFIEGTPVAYASYYGRKKWHLIDYRYERDFNFLEEKIGTDFEIISQNQLGTIWILFCSIPDEGQQWWLYFQKESKLLPLKVERRNLSKMYPLVVQTRDGKTLVCYYTLPKELDREGCLEAPIPLVAVIHGGPFKVRDRYEFHQEHQWLARCGYAALSINFRLSSGFGTSFVAAGNGQWGQKAHLDVIDAVEECIKKGIGCREKLAIFGGSYGGYEVLAALTFTPNFFSCGVALCAPSNLNTVLAKVPEFWEFTAKPPSDRLHFFTKQAFIKSMGGDPLDATGASYLEKRSPVNYVDQIVAPLLIIHGLNDHVVNEAESRQIYEKMQKNHKEVEYLAFADEGHRIYKYENIICYLNQAEKFLAKHLLEKESKS